MTIERIANFLISGHFVRPVLYFKRQSNLAGILVINIWRAHLLFYIRPTSPMSLQMVVCEALYSILDRYTGSKYLEHGNMYYSRGMMK